MEHDVTQVTVARVVQRGVALCDPNGADDICRELLLAFEDDDRPAASVAAAIAFYLSTKPTGGSDDEATIREAVRVVWGDHPPEHVSAWLAAQGLDA
jgi:hypothetical protein